MNLVYILKGFQNLDLYFNTNAWMTEEYLQKFYRKLIIKCEVIKEKFCSLLITALPMFMYPN